MANNPINLIIKKKIASFIWGLNDAILQKRKIVEDYKKKLHKPFDNKLDKGTKL